MDLGGFDPKVIVRKAVLLIAAAAALAACGATAVVALAFTAYALLRGPLTPPGASAAVVGIVCVLAGILGLIAYFQVVPAKRKVRTGKNAPPEEQMSTIDRLAQTVRERPIIAAGAALAAGLVALRNPLLVTTIVTALTRKPRNPR